MSNTQCKFFIKAPSKGIELPELHTVLATQSVNGRLTVDLETKSPDIRQGVPFCHSDRGVRTGDGEHDFYFCSVKVSSQSCMSAKVEMKDFDIPLLSDRAATLVGETFPCKQDEYYCNANSGEDEDYGVVDAMPSSSNFALIGLGVMASATILVGACVCYARHSHTSVASNSHEHGA